MPDKFSFQIDITDDGSPHDEQITKHMLDPAHQAAVTLSTKARMDCGVDLSLPQLTKELKKQCDNLNDGDMSRPESMLLTQAHLLDSLCNKLIGSGVTTLFSDNCFESGERMLKLALKAQHQSQATLRTLGELKQPKQTAFIKQANVAHGHQQINNGSDDESRAKESENQQNELLTEGSVNDLVGREKSQTVANDSEMEAVGTFDRPKNRARKNACK